MYVTPGRLLPSISSASAHVSAKTEAFGTAERLARKNRPSVLAKWAPASFFVAPTVTKPQVPWVLIPSRELSQATMTVTAATGRSQAQREGERSWRITFDWGWG